MIYILVEYGHRVSDGYTIHSYYTTLADAEAAMETVKYETDLQEGIKLVRKEKHIVFKKYQVCAVAAGPVIADVDARLDEIDQKYESEIDAANAWRRAHKKGKTLCAFQCACGAPAEAVRYV